MRGFVLRCILLACIAASNCPAQPFFFRKDIPIGAGALAVVSGDFNGDHRPDLAVQLWIGGVFTLLNDGRGNFGRPIRAGVDSGLFQLGFPLTADFNGDGQDDLVMADGTIFLSLGNGTFRAGQQLNNDRQYLTRVVAAADFNGDGKSDLVVSVRDSGTRVLLSNGDGTFRPGPTISPLFAMTAAVADFNRDARNDLAITTDFMMDGFEILVLAGNGDGTFADPIQTTLQPIAGGYRLDLPPARLIVADFNGDGILDLATAAGVMLGKGDGRFDAPLAYPTLQGRAAHLMAYAAADFNADGRADLVVGNGTNSLYICLANRDGSLSAPLNEYSIGWGAAPPAVVADFDNDGRRDLVVANGSSNTLSLLMARGQESPALRRALSAASGTAIVAVQSLASLFAPTSATLTASAQPWASDRSMSWPTRLGGISLEVRDSAGTTRLAPLLFVSPTQINFEVPAGTAAGEAVLSIVKDSGTAEAGSMQVDSVAPALFGVSPGGLVPAATAMLVKPDGHVVTIPVFTCSATEDEGNDCKLSPIPLSTADGPIYISFFGTGFHGAHAENVFCYINGEPMPVLYAGPQGTPGLDQINIRLSPNIFPNMGYEVAIVIDGVASNTTMLNIQ